MRLDVRLLRVEGRMHTEHPVVQIKRLLFLLLHPRHGLRRHAILDVLSGRLLFEVRKLPWRDKTARRPRPRMMRQIEIKALLKRRIRLRPEVPLPEMCRGVARVLQCLRQRAILRLQPRRRIRLDRLLIHRSLLARRRLQDDPRLVAVRHRDARACRTEPREQRRARRRAQRTRRIRPRESHPAFRQSFDIGCLVKRCLAVK